MSSIIGFIGLGNMGKPMSLNLLKAGHELVVYDIAAKPLQEVVDAGAAKGKSSRDVAERSGIIITMLPDGANVEKAVVGTDGILEGARAGSLLVDMSSVNPHVSMKIAASCAEKGLDFLDAPVSGGQLKAIDGTLAIMVGGDREVFNKALPVLQAMAASVTLTGGVGAGSITKLANQIIVACNIAAMGEAFVFASKAGLDPELVFHAIKDGLAGSEVLNQKMPLWLERNFEPGGAMKLHQKDLRNALQSAESLQAPLPMTKLVKQMIDSLINDGKGEMDHSAIVCFAEQSAQVEINKKE